MTRRVVGLGFPAHISVEKQRYGFGTQTHLEKKVILEKWYSDLRAYLPELYESKPEEFEKKFSRLFVDAFDFIEALEETYHSSFEGINSCSPDEKKFNRLMRGTHICLNEITAKSHILDKEELVFDSERV